MRAHDFDRPDWDRHWVDASGAFPPNPAVLRETAGLEPGTALDAGCGTGVEARSLATSGWTVTGVDLSRTALDRAASADPMATVTWVEADLTVWVPARPFDLVVSCYAHATIPQLSLYARLAGWVAPGGTLLLVGHGHGSGTRHGDASPHETVVTARSVSALLPPDAWRIETADERSRAVSGQDGAEHPLRDVVVRATRLRTPAASPAPSG